jgi:hypothetical protein
LVGVLSFAVQKGLAQVTFMILNRSSGLQSESKKESSFFVMRIIMNLRARAQTRGAGRLLFSSDRKIAK